MIDMYDIVFIEGNKKYMNLFRHIILRESIMNRFKKYKTTFIQSDLSTMDHIPPSKVYIGFSQGTRYFKKMSGNSLKISIGGISGKDILLYKNKDDNARKGDVSTKSLESHFTLSEKTKKSIEKNTIKYIRNYNDNNTGF